MLLLSLYLRPVQGLPWKTWFCAKVEKVGPQFLSLRHFGIKLRFSALADAGAVADYESLTEEDCVLGHGS